mmetsp:Transcript_18930/g.30941  ORF Transcript_18930/g.30941 Transcript_18930/m.30941 type:complete len:86 (+) Transcript_18930:69-326(+)
MDRERSWKMDSSSWCDEEWIRTTCHSGNLRVSDVMYYFERSPFYDVKCNNELLRVQNKGLELLVYVLLYLLLVRYCLCINVVVVK